MKTILVPTDFSANARTALLVAARVALRRGAKLQILHANTTVAYAPPLPEYYAVDQFNTAAYAETAVSNLFSLKKELLAMPGFEKLAVETRIEEGFLYSTIRRIAEEDKVDLVVMGTKGAQGAVEFFVGSNTEKVIRTAPCPVLAVPEGNVEFDPANVVFPSTLRADQHHVFKTLAAWQEAYPFKVQVLYLNNPAGFDNNQQIEQAVHTFCAEAWLKDATPFVNGNTFNEEASILQFAEETNADLIVMGTHQRQGLSHLLFGSLTEDTVNHSTIPVLSIPVK